MTNFKEMSKAFVKILSGVYLCLIAFCLPCEAGFRVGFDLAKFFPGSWLDSNLLYNSAVNPGEQVKYNYISNDLSHEIYPVISFEYITKNNAGVGLTFGRIATESDTDEISSWLSVKPEIVLWPAFLRASLPLSQKVSFMVGLGAYYLSGEYKINITEFKQDGSEVKMAIPLEIKKIVPLQHAAIIVESPLGNGLSMKASAELEYALKKWTKENIAPNYGNKIVSDYAWGMGGIVFSLGLNYRF